MTKKLAVFPKKIRLFPCTIAVHTRNLHYVSSLLFSWLVFISTCGAYHHPIQFAIPARKVVKEIPTKDRDFAFINPKDTSTYIYQSEQPYYEDYQRSYFGITSKKAGWDCMRHYEILANGCIPYFIDLDQCHPDTMAFLPKELISEAMQLPGVSYETLSIDHETFDHARYREIVTKLLEHTRQYLTTESMARYLLNTMNYSGQKPILFLSYDTSPDYLRCLMLTGLKQILGNRVIDFPQIPHIYTDYPGDIKKLYGKGITYTKNVSPSLCDRSHIEQRIRNREFELVIYGSLHRGLLFHDLVLHHYRTQEIAYLCGEDDHNCIAPSSDTHLFLREQNCLKRL